MASEVASINQSPEPASSPYQATGGDPFNVTPSRKSPKVFRFSPFDTKLFATYTRDSPTQAKRALEAHIAETDRRIQGASKLGTTLLSQRKQLADRLKEVEQQREDEEINPELRQKLSELEKEYNDVGKETARAFIPKSRALSPQDPNFNTAPSTLSANAQSSPSKLQVPSRKQRNQPSTRVKDLEFATEISSSLLGQVRHLQALLAEKEATLKSTEAERSKLESETSGLVQKLRGVDENEQKYKDENWNLETQVQDLMAAAKEATAREQQLLQSLNAAKLDKSSAVKECEELKISHAKLNDEHDSFKKLQEAELFNMRRNMSSGDHERETLQRRIEELISHNQDLAKAVAYRSGKGSETMVESEAFDNSDADLERHSPEHSPPPSPSKATPRHANLESDTLKGSLTHAHRQIQNMRSRLHRETQEKIELKRMLQDARDEVELRRTTSAAGAAKRLKQNNNQFKKPARPDKLGSRKLASEEIISDPNWEEYDGVVSNVPAPDSNRRSFLGDTTDAYQTANEKASSATDTEAFETGVENLADDSDDLTETEGNSANLTKSLGLEGRMHRSRLSVDSTASDDADFYNSPTPPNSQQRYKLKVKGYRRTNDADSSKGSPASFMSSLHQPSARNLAAELQGSPASFISSSSPAVGQSLAAELQGFRDDASIASTTPGRSVISREVSPEFQKRRVTALHDPIDLSGLNPTMVDSGMLTDPWKPESEFATMSSPASETLPSAILESQKYTTSNSASLNREFASAGPLLHENPVTTVKKSIHDITDNSETITAMSLDFSPLIYQHIEPVPSEISNAEPQKALECVIVPQHLTYSSISSQHVEPIETKFSVLPPAHKSVGESIKSTLASVMPNPFKKPALEGEQTKRNSTEAAKTSNIARSLQSPQPATRAKAKEYGDLDLSEDANSTENGFHEPTFQVDDLIVEPRTPLKQVSGNSSSIINRDFDFNTNSRFVNTTDEGTQTVVSAEQIDYLIKEKNRKSASFSSVPPSPTQSIRRPGSSGSLRREITSPPLVSLPPLPLDHKEVIAAAASRNISSIPSSMGPPLMSASAYKSQTQLQRPITPKEYYQPSLRNASTSRVRNSSMASRRSSVSSFASELDQRFGIQSSRNLTMPDGFEVSSADPRMIQAITQTMIGEYLWKYTRKAGRGEISEKRHRRFFWIHPYTRTLYWSDSDPSAGGRGEAKAKSVAIEAVRVVSDNNPIPPGLHTKSIVILTPGRQIKFTAPTAQRHETWFNALSYLMVRSSPELDESHIHPQKYYSNYSNSELLVDPSSLNADDVSEFNPVSPALRKASSHRSMSSINADRNSYLNRGRSMPPNSTMNSANSRSMSKRAQRVPSTPPPKTLIDVIAEAEQSRNNTPRMSTTKEDIDGREAYEGEDDEATPRPRAASSARPVSATTSSAAKSSGRIGSFANRFTSFRGRSTRARGVNDDLDTASPTKAAAAGSQVQPSENLPKPPNFIRDGSVDSHGSRMSMRGSGIAKPSGPGWGMGMSMGAVENVRACCDGKHDVGHLSHRSTSLNRASRHRNAGSMSSRQASISSRTSFTVGNGTGGPSAPFIDSSKASRYSQQSLV